MTALRLVAALALNLAFPCDAAQLRVMVSGGFAAAYDSLVQQFQRETGHTISTARGPSMGSTPQAIPNRIDRGEPVDVLIMVREALDSLAERSRVAPESRVDLARSTIAMALNAGDVVLPIPPDTQKITVLSAGIASTSTEPDAAKQLIDFLSSRKVHSAISHTGLEPIER